MIFRSRCQRPIDPTWRKWFAWRPVFTEAGHFVWLDWVERREDVVRHEDYTSVGHLYRLTEDECK